MKIQCACGHLIHDNADRLGHKAHLVTDRRWADLFDALDGWVDAGTSPGRREAAFVKISTVFSQASRSAWQCDACGRLYIEDDSRTLNAFLPEDGGAAKRLFAGDDAVDPAARRR